MKKKLYILAAATMALASCSQEDRMVEGNASSLKTMEITAGMPGGDSRTSFTDGGIKWQEGDALSVFVGGNVNHKFTINPADSEQEMGPGYNTAKFTGVNVTEGEDYANYVAYYPYAEGVTLTKSEEAYTLNATFPTVQPYAAEGSFGANSLPMVAVTDAADAQETYAFKSLGGWMQLYVKGNATITKVVMKANGHKIAGDYTVSANYDETPSIEMKESAVDQIVLESAEGVQLSANQATLFTFAVAPFSFDADEVSFDIYDNEGGIQRNAYTIAKAGTIMANAYYTLSKSNAVVYNPNDSDSEQGYVAPGLFYDNENKAYHIKNAKGLVALSTLTIKGGEKIFLDKNIDLTDVEFTGLSAFQPENNNTFDGQGYTVSNWTYTGKAGDMGFCKSWVGTIKNVKFENCHLETGGRSGIVAGNVYANIENVEVNNCSITDSYWACGIIAGLYNNGNISNCKVTNSSVKSNGGTAAIAGVINETAGTRKISNCEVRGTTVHNTGVYGEAYSGALFAGMFNAGNATYVFENCTFEDNTIEGNHVENALYNSYSAMNEIVIVDGEYRVHSINTLKKVIDNAQAGDTTIGFGEDISGNITIQQKENVNITLNGRGKKFDGTIIVDGAGRSNGAETLKFYDIKFETEGSDFTFIKAESKIDGHYNYSHNVTIENCTFRGNQTVGSASFTGTYNFLMKNCEAENMHSILQTQSCANTVTVENVTVTNCKNGLSFGNTAYPTLKNSNIQASEYGVRGDGNANRGNLVIENTTIKAKQPVIIRKTTTDSYTVNLQGNTLTPNNNGDYHIVFTKGDDAAEYVIPTVSFTLNGGNDYKVYGIPVAMVGTTKYCSIDDAIANWTNGSTLTLLNNVTLSDVVTLKSTEHHILNLGTYTLTASSGKHAIEITCEGRSSASYALTVNADATNPGGITANGKSCIYYKKSGSTKDRPIILINNGVFNGSYSINSTSNGNTNCPQIWINGGTFNAYMNLTKNMLRISGGTFHAAINCTGDSSAYREIKGGRFKSWQFMTADGPTKFWVGSGNGNYNVGVYVDDEGYLVVGGDVITEFGTKFKAKASNYSKWSSYLKYSSAAEYGLYYTNAELAIKKHGESNVELP